MKKKEEPIRIAHIIGKWLGGGVEAVVMNYYRNIDKTKIQFDFICDDDSTNIPYEEIESLGGRVILIPPYQKVFKYHKELKKVLKEGNYKIVHSHINVLSVFSLWAAKSAGVPIRIAHSHATTNKKEIKRHIIKLILRPLSKVFATHYLCCSEVAGRWQFGNKMYNSGKVRLLHNAIDLNKFLYNEEIRNKIRKELKIQKDACVIGHVGRLVQTKNQSFVIDVFNEFQTMNPNSILVLAGQGPDLNILKDKVKKLKLKEKVLFLGQRKDINDIFQAFDLFMLPSLYEGLGMTLIEAQVSGLKCIASTNVPEESKIIDDVDYLKLEDDAKKWASRLAKYNIKLRKSYVNKFKKAGYDIKIEARKLEEYYINLYNEV